MENAIFGMTGLRRASNGSIYWVLSPDPLAVRINWSDCSIVTDPMFRFVALLTRNILRYQDFAKTFKKPFWPLFQYCPKTKKEFWHLQMIKKSLKKPSPDSLLSVFDRFFHEKWRGGNVAEWAVQAGDWFLIPKAFKNY